MTEPATGFLRGRLARGRWCAGWHSYRRGGGRPAAPPAAEGAPPWGGGAGPRLPLAFSGYAASAAQLVGVERAARRRRVHVPNRLSVPHQIKRRAHAAPLPLPCRTSGLLSRSYPTRRGALCLRSGAMRASPCTQTRVDTAPPAAIM